MGPPAPRFHADFGWTRSIKGAPIVTVESWSLSVSIRYSCGVLTTAVLVTSFGAPVAAQPSQSPAVVATASGQTQKPIDSDQPKTKAGEFPRFAWDQHPSVLFGKGTRISALARLQGHVRDSEAPEIEESAQTLDFARRRVGVEGEIANKLFFQVEAEIGSSEIWRDVYANYTQFDTVQIQGGKFKLPFGLEENTGSTNLDFVYRSMASTRLAPGRDIGVMVHGRVLNRFLRYEVGGFDHDGRNARSNDPEHVFGGPTLVGRVDVLPFRHQKSELSDLMVGVAYTTTDVDEGLSGLQARTVFGYPFLSEPDLWVNGPRRRLGVEARIRPGPASIKSEYMRLTSARLGQGTDGSDLRDFEASGWYVSGTWVLTGEKKADNVDRPRHPFLRGGIGAVEIGARLEELTFGTVNGDPEASTSPRADVVLGNANRAATFGVNWYLNRWVKIQGNVIKQTIKDPLQGPLPERPSFWSSVLRFQLSI
jgi:phosphate-selective porin OprO and OprP